jgi:hypothetical protein
MRQLVTAGMIVAVAGLAGCASGGGGGGGSDRDFIMPEELAQVQDQAPDAYRVVERLRPNWLRSRSNTLAAPNPLDNDLPGAGSAIVPEVFVDGVHFGALDSLHNLASQNVEQLQYLDSRDATTRYGTGYPAGIISVTMK